MKFLKYTLALLLIVSISSCEDYLNSPAPQQSLPLEGGISTAQDVENLLLGAYNDVQDGQIMGAQSVLFSEIMADNTIWTGSFPTFVQIAGRDMDAGNGSVGATWNDYFDALNTVNIILDVLPEIDDPALEADRIRGEALFLRGLINFSAVRLYGLPWSTGDNNSNPGIPIRTSPVTSSADFENPSRNTVAEVYAQIVSDLQGAIDAGVPATVGASRGTSLGATALLSRVRLNQGQYQEAADLAGQVISSEQYSLDSSVLAIFRDELTGESIFEIVHTVQDNPGINDALPTFYAIDGRDDVQISTDYVDATEQIITPSQEAALTAAGQSAEDTRVTQLLSGTSTGTGSSTDSNSLKFDSGVNTDDNVPIIRYAEVLLTRAEALAETSATIADVPQEAFDLVNQIRRRAIVVTDGSGNQAASEAAIEYQRSDFATVEAFVDAILLERRVELSFEGHRLHDLQRRQLDVRGLPYNSNDITFPIPVDELDANPNISQNPGY